jgi:hypothetical protein
MMKRISGTQIVINFIGSIPVALFRDTHRNGPGLFCRQLSHLGHVQRRPGFASRERKGYRYTLADQTTVTESTSADFQFSNRHCGANKLTNLFNQCLAGVRK